MTTKQPTGRSRLRPIIRAAIRTAIALATVAAAAAQVTMHPGGGVSCPGAYYAQRLDGRLIIVCPPPPVSKQQADEYGRAWLKEHEEEAARQEADRMTRRCKEIPRPSFCN